MRQGQGSKTADASAAARAAATYEEPCVLKDPFAATLTSPGWRMLLKSPPLRAAARWLYDRLLPGAMGTVLVRARAAEEQLERSGAGQYVLLGAGLDSFGLRRPELAGRLVVYELDHPASQEVKRDRLRRAGVELPPHVRLVPIDFERDDLESALSAAGYQRERPALFAWLGVSYYLTLPANERLWRDVARVAAPGSELVFDYFEAEAFRPDGRYRSARRYLQFAARRGEPILTGLDPETLAERLAASGFRLEEDLSPEDQVRRFMQGTGRRPCEFIHIARASTPRRNG